MAQVTRLPKFADARPMVGRAFVPQRSDGTFPDQLILPPTGPDGTPFTIEAMILVDENGDFLSIDALYATSFIQTLFDDPDALTARATLGAAPLDSPIFTGTPAAPTPALGTNTTQLATAAFVRAEVAALVGTAPGTLDTLGELSDALNDNPNYAANLASSAGTSFIGHIQTGAGAETNTVQSKLRQLVSVLDYIPAAEHAAILAGTSVYDAGADLQDAFNSGHRYIFVPPGKYNTSVRLTASNLRLIGAGQGYSRILLTAAAVSVLRLQGACTVESLEIYAGLFGDYGIELDGAALSVIENNKITTAHWDAIHFNTGAINNNAIKIRDNLIQTGGRCYSNAPVQNVNMFYATAAETTSGTAANNADSFFGSSVVTFTGAPDWTTKKLRAGKTWAKIGTADWREVTAITATTITVFPGITNAQAGVGYTLIDGAGIRTNRHGDSGVYVIEGNTVQNINGAAMDFSAQYGGLCQQNTLEANLFAYALSRNNDGSVMHGQSCQNDYVEVCPGGHFRIGYCKFLAIINPLMDLVAEDGRDAIGFGYHPQTPSTTGMPFIQMSGDVYNEQTRIFSVGLSGDNAASTVAFGETLRVDTNSGTLGLTVNLPVVPAISSKSDFILERAQPRVRIAVARCSVPVAVKTTDGQTLNGAAGATGIKIVGDYQLVEFFYYVGLGWYSSTYHSRGESTQDVASIAANANASFTITVPGAAISDVVSLSYSSVLETGLIPHGEVTAANTVTVRLFNVTAAAIDPANRTYYAQVTKR